MHQQSISGNSSKPQVVLIQIHRLTFSFCASFPGNYDFVLLNARDANVARFKIWQLGLESWNKTSWESIQHFSIEQWTLKSQKIEIWPVSDISMSLGPKPTARCILIKSAPIGLQWLQFQQIGGALQNVAFDRQLNDASLNSKRCRREEMGSSVGMWLSCVHHGCTN